MLVRSSFFSASMRPEICSNSSGSTRGVEAQRDRAQGELDRRLRRLAVGDVEPAAQCAVAFAQLERQRRRGACSSLHVGARQVGVDAAAPATPVAGSGRTAACVKRPRTLKRSPQLCRRRRVEAQVVLAQAVAHDQLDVREHERRRVAALVDPAQRAGADHELALAEEPVGGGIVVLDAAAAGDVEAGDADAAAPCRAGCRGSAPSISSCAKRGSRASTLRGDSAAKTRGRVSATRCSASRTRTSLQLERRHPAARARRNRADLHGRAEHAAGVGLDGAAPFLDVRQNEPVK